MEQLAALYLAESPTGIRGAAPPSLAGHQPDSNRHVSLGAAALAPFLKPTPAAPSSLTRNQGEGSASVGGGWRKRCGSAERGGGSQ